MATFELKQTVFTYELGQEVSQNIEDYVICPDRIKITYFKLKPCEFE